MDHQVVGLAIDTAGAFLMMALALWVWRVRPHSRMNLAFAQLVTCLALGALFYNIGWLTYYSTRTEPPGEGLLGLLGGLFFILSAWFIIKLERSLPDPQEPATRRLASWMPLVLALLNLVLSAQSILRIAGGAGVGSDPVTGVSVAVTGSAMSVVTSVALYLIVRLAIRYEEAATEAHLRWQAAAVALALGAFPLFASSTAAIEVPILGAERSPLDGLVLIPMVLATLTWIVAGMGRNGRLAIVTGLALLSLVLAGVAAAAAFGSIIAINSGAIGALRLAGTALLAYTIVRHQLFEIELKLKWTLRRGTMAAIFIATFFVASEGAQALFSEFAGDELVGILAAGLLVFFLAPLQRLADLLSDAAMPSVQDTPAYRESRRREIYLAAMRSVLKDGIVTERERDVLATLADQLELTSTEALDLERQASSIARD